MEIHRLALVSLALSMLAYASAFVGSQALVWPALIVAVLAVVCGGLARRATLREPKRYAGGAIALAGMLSGAAFVALSIALILLARSATSG